MEIGIGLACCVAIAFSILALYADRDTVNFESGDDHYDDYE